MDFGEAFFLLAAVLGVLIFVGALMVSCGLSLHSLSRAVCAVLMWVAANAYLFSFQIGSAWFLGARFDKIFKDYGDDVKEAVITAANAAKDALPTAIRDEL